MMINRVTVLRLLNSCQSDLHHLGVRRLALFGSMARDEASQGSDVDLLVEFNPPITFDRYMRVKFYLEDLLQCPVDLVFPETLKTRVRPFIERDLIYVA